ncbi:hypothetical protein OUZ56_012585 [Daphnia magna]|uniref:Uncharacterized protein n=1 Tax=Daphnia magna TaxID=35525 RepID=A0ABQ9Z3H3_9CRUS|nr:hypothetical protein OUZ56_012585 [Daphnia magna]
MRSRLLPHAIPSIYLTPEEGNEPQLPTVQKGKLLMNQVALQLLYPLKEKHMKESHVIRYCNYNNPIYRPQPHFM